MRPPVLCSSHTLESKVTLACGLFEVLLLIRLPLSCKADPTPTSFKIWYTLHFCWGNNATQCHIFGDWRCACLDYGLQSTVISIINQSPDCFLSIDWLFLSISYSKQVENAQIVSFVHLVQTSMMFISQWRRTEEGSMIKRLEPDEVWHICLKKIIGHQNSLPMIFCWSNNWFTDSHVAYL